MKEQRRRLRNRLVQRGFQIRYTVLIVAAPAAVLLVLGTLYYQEIKVQDAMLMNLETTQALLLEQGEGDAEEDPGAAGDGCPSEGQGSPG
ncbi:MAG: hypothetical protein ISR64_02640 [Deltaproteobacteria bacterium]|nr:hypothetical protein [Deltaproteobacteria bacterium]